MRTSLSGFCRRFCIWVTLGVMSSALVIAMYSSDSVCEITGTVKGTVSARRWALGGKTAGPYGIGVAADLFSATALLGFVIDNQGRYQDVLALHRWTWRYALVCTAQAIFHVAIPLSFELCLGDPQAVGAVEAVLLMCTSCCSVVSHSIFCYLTVAKLRLIESPSAHFASRAFKTLSVGFMIWLILFNGVWLWPMLVSILVCIVWALLLIVSITLFCVAVNAYIRAAREATVGASGVKAGLKKTAVWLRTLAFLTAVAAVATVLHHFFFLYTLVIGSSSKAVALFHILAHVLHVGFTAVCALVQCGLVGPRVLMGEQFGTTRDLWREYHKHLIFEKEKVDETSQGPVGPAVRRLQQTPKGDIGKSSLQITKIID